MREIKFRAKALDNNIMVYFSLYEVANYFPDDGVFYVGNIPFKEGSEQEYTGLKDKNGKEIYEGDLFWDTWHQSPLLRVIEFSDGEFVARDTEHIIPMEHLRQWLDNGERKEVIGNIYENKELLKGDKND